MRSLAVRRSLILATLGALHFGAAGCSRVIRQTSEPPSTREVRRNWSPGWLAWINKPKTSAAERECPGGRVSRVERNVTGGNAIVGVLTYLVFTPMSIRVVCAQGPTIARDTTRVAATVAQTWDAMIDVFAEQNIPLRTLDRASGFAVAETARVGEGGAAWAACWGAATPTPPSAASYNVLVRGDPRDSSAAVVRVTVAWSAFRRDAAGDLARVDCETTGRYETDLESAIKARAEARARGTR